MPPNFLFITTDQQRWDTLRCAGNPAIRTPHLDALAARGVRFSRAYPSTPICMPARASMITGRSQRGHQVFEHEINLSENIPVLGDALHEVGYTTALFGKAPLQGLGNRGLPARTSARRRRRRPA